MTCKICKQRIDNSLTTWMVSKDPKEHELQYLIHKKCSKN